MPTGIYKHSSNQGFKKGNKIQLGKKISEEHKKKIGIGNKGKVASFEVRKKLSEAHKGKHFSLTTRRKMSLAQAREKGSNWKGGKPQCEICDKVLSTRQVKRCKKHRIITEQMRRNISDGHKGSKNHLWKGGITLINEKIRKSFEYKLWRRAVLERDKYQCIWGGKEHGNKLQADHIKPFALFPELRFAIDNGRTLCVECHRNTDTWGIKALNYANK